MRFRWSAALLAAVLALGLSSSWAAEAIKSDRSGAAESNHVFCDATGASPVHKAPCFIRDGYMTTGAVAGYLLTFNATSAPADGALDGTAGHEKPVDCLPVAANSFISLSYGDTSEPYVAGMTAFFKGRAQ